MKRALCVVALLFASCGSDETDCDIGTVGCACTSGGACDPGLQCVSSACIDPRESQSRGTLDEAFYGDWPDCYSNCSAPYDLNPFDVSLSGLPGERVFTANESVYETMEGEIDDGPHDPGFGYDVDLFRVRVPPNNLVEVRVRALGASIDPYVSTFDPELIDLSPLFGYMTQNDDAEPTGLGARTVIASPLGDNEPWMVVVDDARNIRGDGPVGGSGFRYEVTFRTIGRLTLRDLDLASGTASANGTLELAGDLHYYRFVDPLHRSHVVTFDTDDPEFCGHVWQIDLNGRAAWILNGDTDDTPADGCDSPLTFPTAPIFYEDGTDAYGIVVTDYLGRGRNLGNGQYDYTLTVTLP